MDVSGCESIGWTVAAAGEETIMGPNDVEYMIYLDLDQYQQALVENDLN